MGKGAVEMARQLRMNTILLENPGSIPNTHVKAHSHPPGTPVPGYLTSGFQGHHVCVTDKRKHIRHIT